MTGYLENGETPEQSVLREVKEELGLDAEISHFIGHYSLLKRNQVILAYQVSAVGGIKPNDELVEYKLMSHKDLAALVPVEVSMPISPVYRPSGVDSDITILPLVMWCWKRVIPNEKSRQ
ncbi:MAG: NUDIX hydrolase [Pseudomonadota bacterium]